MSLSKGDIVLVPFPFTNLTATKLRPAIVLWSKDTCLDVTVCFVSSQNITSLASEEFLISSNDPEFSKTGLKITSKVRVSRIVTIERRLLVRKIGSLGKTYSRLLDQTLVTTFKLQQ